MMHLLVALLAPRPHHPSFDPDRLAELLGPANLEHRWAPHGYTIARTTAERRLILHTWPEAGRASLDLYGTHDLRSEAADLARRLGWSVTAAVDEERLLSDLQAS